MKRKIQQSGLTLVELMITLSVAAILLTIAVPSYVSFTANNRSSSEANRLVSAINLARSEAVKRGVAVSLCSRKLPRTNPETCAGNTAWESGWLLFTDTSGTAGSFDGTDELLEVWESVSGNPTFTGSANNIQYQTTGVTTATASFILTYPDCVGDNIRTVAIGLTGRAAVTTGTCP